MKPRKTRLQPNENQEQTRKPRKQQVEPQEPLLEDCPWCHGMHTAGTVEMCPLKPKK